MAFKSVKQKKKNFLSKEFLVSFILARKFGISSGFDIQNYEKNKSRALSLKRVSISTDCSGD